MSQKLSLEQQLQLLNDLQGTGREYSSVIADEIAIVQEKLRIKRMLDAEVCNDSTVGSTEYTTMCSVCCEYNCTDTHQDYIDSMEAGAGTLKGPVQGEDLNLDLGFVLLPSPGDHITVFTAFGRNTEIDALVIRQLQEHRLVVFAQDRICVVEAVIPLESSEFYIVRSLDAIKLYDDYL